MVVVFSLVNGALLAKGGYYWPWYFLGGALLLTGASLMCQSSHASPLVSVMYVDSSQMLSKVIRPRRMSMAIQS